MIITKETDYALRILRVLLDGEKHSVAEMSETEFIPNQFAYQILRKLSAGNDPGFYVFVWPFAHSPEKIMPQASVDFAMDFFIVQF